MTNRKQPTRQRRRRANRGGAQSPSTDVSVPAPMRPYVLTRSFNYGTISPVANDYGGQLTATLSQVPASSELTALFQEYRIDYAWYEFTFLPAATERYTPVLWFGNYVVNIGTPPVSLDEVLQTSGQRKFAFGPDKRTIKLGFKPKVRTSETIVQLRASPWLSTITPSATHTGMWFWMQHFNATSSLGSSISITGTFRLSFRGTV